MDFIKTLTVLSLFTASTWAAPTFKKKGGLAVHPVYVEQPTYVQAQPPPQIIHQPIQVQPVQQHPPKQIIIQPVQVQPVRPPPPPTQIIVQPVKLQPAHPPPKQIEVVIKPIIVKPVISKHPVQQHPVVVVKPGKHHKF